MAAPTKHASTQHAGGAVGQTVPGAAEPLCFVVDDESSTRHFLSLILHGAGIDTMEFIDGSWMRQAIVTKRPQLIFHNVSVDVSDVQETMAMLGRLNYRGAVQLMSNRGGSILGRAQAAGEHYRLNMLPALKKPFESEAILGITRGLNLGHLPPDAAGQFGLAEALANGWIEFWYQPKIDLRRKILAGAEVFVRARHPTCGIASPAAFMMDASDADILKLAEMAVLNALKASVELSRLGVNLRVAINAPLDAVERLPIAEMVAAHRSPSERWLGLIIDVTEAQIVSDLPHAIALTRQLEKHNVRLAVDDFGRNYAMLARIKEMPFAELKLDRAFVTDCGSDKVNAPLCKTVIDLAHAYGGIAVGVGIEKAADVFALTSMGCDLGQGFLMGQPMPQDRFFSLLRQRAAAISQATATTIQL